MKSEEIKKVAEQVFAKVPDAPKAYITSDGQGFARKNMAELHKNTNAKKAKLQVYEIDRSALLGTAAPPEGTAEKKEAPKNQKRGTKNQKEAKATPEDRSADDPETGKPDPKVAESTKVEGAENPASEAAAESLKPKTKNSKK